MARASCFAALLLAAWIWGSSALAARVTLADLVQQMTDLSLLSRFPDPPYVTGQFSSFDRASVSPKDAESWFANNDRGYSLYDGIVTQETPYYRTGPQQAAGPDGKFAPGTRVGLDPNHKLIGRQYVWVYASGPDGRPIDGKLPQGYIVKSAITMDPQGHVLADMPGPGCVTRIWSANPSDAGHIRIYLEGSGRPVIDAPMDALLSGKWQSRRGLRLFTPFPEPLAQVRGRGATLYFPIPYARRCKVTVDNSNIYYHVDYRTYPKGTQIDSFRLTAPSMAKLVQDTVSALERPGSAALAASAKGSGTLAAGGQLAIDAGLLKKGPGAIAALSFRLRDVPLRRRADILRSLVLVATFDDAKQPQVWCPLGDFFGTAPDANAYSSLPLRVDASIAHGRSTVDLESRWWMPFEKAARLEVHNAGTQKVELEYEVNVKAYRWDERSMHFHAKWRSETMNTRPFRDWNYCTIEGQGVFVGDALSVMNPSPAWWGEGDEKICVDGESFPSWFGTGTEDYYGYAWSDPHPFHHAYHNQTRCDGPGNYGRTSVNRFHILDAIPFTKSFRFDMEVWHWTPNIDVNYAAVSYWYARPGATDNFVPADAAALRKLPAPPPPHQIAGAIEAEHMKFLAMSKPEFEVDPQLMVEFGEHWSNNEQLWARPNGGNQWVELRLPVPADGRYKLIAYLTKARDYGIIQFAVNGHVLGRPFDGFNAGKVIATGPVELGTLDLKKGGATLRVTTIGTNPRSQGNRYMWGLDCIVLKRDDK